VLTAGGWAPILPLVPMKLRYFQVNAFTSTPFGGNPAGVCPLERWLPDSQLQAIAAENDLSETAFLVRRDEDFELRWFTPAVEVDLCGHATLASAIVLFQELGLVGHTIRFHTKSGLLQAARRDDWIELDFPARPPEACPAPPALVRGLGREPAEIFRSRDYLAVFSKESEVASLAPDFNALGELDCLGIIVTAPGVNVDFVSRFFAPRAGIGEDPVTGSSHCTLIPFWAARLRKDELIARQISPRGGDLRCRNLGPRVGIAGRGWIYLRGEIEV
jgi:predicted PhzF superfamily epimerase YddE/YHI9